MKGALVATEQSSGRADYLIPAREGQAFELNQGARIVIRDSEGHQCVDTWAFVADDVSEYLSASHTRTHVDRLFPIVGEEFVTNRRRPILRFEEDSSPGRHDMLFAACDAPRFAQLGVEGWHGSCEENLLTAMREAGHPEVVVPQSLNLFMSTTVHPDDTIEWDPILDSPGDSVTFTALLPCIVVISACPQDITTLNDKNPTPVGVEVHGD